MKRPDTVLPFLIIAAAFCAAGPTHAEDFPDRVTLQLDDEDSRIVVACRVLSFEGDTIRLKLPTGDGEKSYPASQVVSIETPQVEAHRKALTLLEEGDHRGAGQQLQRALNTETRSWVRRDILALLVREALRTGDYASAVPNFIALAASDPQTRHYDLAPLVWSDADASGSLQAEARLWRNQPGEAAKLAAASVLLADPEMRAGAESDLRELKFGGNAISVRRLASAQLWRLELLGDDVSDEEVRRWEDEIEAMPEEIRGGPYYLLGRARAQRREYDLAAAALLWVPLVHDADANLAARAELEAADALRTLGQWSEAATLYREVAERFPQSRFAEQALAALSELAASPTP